MANLAVHDIEQAYMAITHEFQEQRDQLIRRLQHVKKDIQQYIYFYLYLIFNFIS